MNKKPWERRLKDLSHLLQICAKTYFDPELFRINLNQFLQTSRTVTFIIQKNKSEIEGFDSWYPENIVDKWSSDPLMTWAKNSRNVIEKQGDLEMFSEAKATLIFSYVEEQDIEISTRNELLGIGVKKLVRLAQKKLPSGMTESAVIKSERRWVANSLKDYELLHALTIIYSRVYESCKSLGAFINNPISEEITTPNAFDSLRNEVRHVNYLKLKNFSTGKVSYETISYDESIIPDSLKDEISAIEQPCKVTSVHELVEHMGKLTEINFLNSGFHIQCLFFFNDNYQVIDMMSTSFEDQGDKYVFWRIVADRAMMINAFGFVWISELWLRNANRNYAQAIHKMPIIDERLQIIGIDAKNNQKSITWRIIRESEESKPTLELMSSESRDENGAYFMRPILKAIGGDISKVSY